MLCAGNMRACAQTVKLWVGENIKDATPRAKGPQGLLLSGDGCVREAFTNNFKTLLWGGSTTL
eukprot:351479-Chlamydomonas_euryale.AAC.33